MPEIRLAGGGSLRWEKDEVEKKNKKKKRFKVDKAERAVVKM